MKLGTADKCIYCGGIGEEDEHVIAYSLGGKFVIQSGSCDPCSKITSALEGSIARKTYLLARTAFGVQSRRPKDAPKSVEVSVVYGKFGPTKRVSIPIDDAPLSIILPHYRPLAGSQYLISEIVMEAAAIPSVLVQRERARSITERHRARQITAHSAAIRPERFTQLLWKIACGFFWATARRSYTSSAISDFAIGRQKPEFVDQDILGDRILVKDIFSKNTSRSAHIDGKSRIFSVAAEDHKFLYCEIDLIAAFGFPIYYCRIPNLERKEIVRDFD